MEVRAVARGVRRSPFKVRRIVDVVRGKPVGEALAILRFMISPAATDVSKVIRSAAANAQNNFEMDPRRLNITSIYVDEGPVMKRIRARSRGRVSPILKRTCHITAIVDEV